MSGFVHLECYSEYSLLSSMARYAALCKGCVDLGMNSLAISDRSNLFCAPNFFKKAKELGIKPVIAARLSYRAGNFTSSCLLYCKNKIAYKNLSFLISKSYENDEKEPYVSREELFSHADGLIVVQCLEDSLLYKSVMRGDSAYAERELSLFVEHFGKDNVYLKVFRTEAPSPYNRNTEKVIAFSEDCGVPVVATNSIHFINKADYRFLGILSAIKEGERLADLKRAETGFEECYLKSEAEMRALYTDFPEACDNTVLIAKSCEFEFDYQEKHLPEFKLPEGVAHHDYLKNKCIEGLASRYGFDYHSCDLSDREKLLKDRLDYELSVVENMGYSDYFLICWDFVSYAKNRGILVGTGRGSGGASLICYVLNITEIDPIEYRLIFERFLNPERVSMPDLDIDFQDDRRHEVIDYVVNKYGKNRVSQIITFGTLSAKQVIRDVGRVLGMEQRELDELSKAVPNKLNITIDMALEENGDFKRLSLKSRLHEEVVAISRKLEGLPRHISTHAAGVVIARDEIYNIHPVIYQDGQMLTQYDMICLEELGLLKMDFLGLRYLSIISHSLKEIERNTGRIISLSKLPLNDKKTYELLSRGDGLGVFQLESFGMLRFMTELKPGRIEDIIVGISLYRPGPMESIPKFLENRRNPSKIKYLSPELNHILDETSGCIVYQEQVLEIVRTLGGFSYGEADNLRRAMSKKKIATMLQYKEQFIHGKLKEDGSRSGGGVSLGISERDLEALYDEMTDFAKYAFNKAHAAGYAIIAYYTAYLKANYPKEYFSALLSSVAGSRSKIAEYIRDAEKMGIKVLNPNLFHSRGDFVVEDVYIRYGLNAIKNVGRKLVEDIERMQDNNKLTSLAEFYKNLSVNSINKKSAESLMLSDVFSPFAYSPSTLLRNFEAMYAYYKPANSPRNESQLTLNDLMEIDGVEDEFSMETGEELDLDYIRKKKFEFLGCLDLISLDCDSAGIYVKLNEITPEDERFFKSLKSSPYGCRLLIYDESSGKLHKYVQRIALSLDTELDFCRLYGRENVKIVLPEIKK